jgi:hypothetical protein
MFHLRTIVILGVLAVALWGLFALLSKLEHSARNSPPPTHARPHT